MRRQLLVIALLAGAIPAFAGGNPTLPSVQVRADRTVTTDFEIVVKRSVFRAKHVPLDRQVAIKLLRPDYDFDPSRVDRFLQEVRAVGFPLSDVLGKGVKITKGTTGTCALSFPSEIR